MISFYFATLFATIPILSNDKPQMSLHTWMKLFFVKFEIKPNFEIKTFINVDIFVSVLTMCNRNAKPKYFKCCWPNAYKCEYLLKGYKIVKTSNEQTYHMWIPTNFTIINISFLLLFRIFFNSGFMWICINHKCLLKFSTIFFRDEEYIFMMPKVLLMCL